MELRHLRYFVAVAEELHFGRAAQRLHIAQPPLSQQIKSLEDELGVRLFNRTKRRVELTEAGRLFLDEARLTLEQAARAEKVAREAQAGVRGRIDLAFVTSAAYSVLPEIIRTFRSEAPGMDLSLHEMIPARQIQALERKEITIGLLRPPVHGACMEVQSILREPLVVALPAGHRLCELSSVPLSALAEEAFVLFPRSHGPGIYDVILAACYHAGFTPHVEYEPNEMQSILAYVAGGLGVSLAPGSLCGTHGEDIVYRPLRDAGAELELALIWPAAHASPALDGFRDLCAGVGERYGRRLHQRLQSYGDLNNRDPI